MVSKVLPSDLNSHRRKKFLNDAKYYFWEEPFFYKYCTDGVIRICVQEEELHSILLHCRTHKTEGYFNITKIVTKV